MSSKYGLLIDYDYCTGCHSCETSCKVVLDLPEGQWGIKILQDGPRQLENGEWDFTYMPLPTELCDLCEDRTEAGKLPLCVHHCQAAVMKYGTIEELSKRLEDKPRQCLFVPC